jgi:hypothetical protein
MSQFPLYLNPHFKTNGQVRRLMVVSIVFSMIAVPTVNAITGTNPILAAYPTFDVFAGFIVIEITFFSLIFGPCGVLGVGVAYAFNRNNPRLMERLAYGFIAGYSIGFLVFLALFGSFPLTPLVGIAAAGFGAGIFVSYLARKPEAQQRSKSAGLIKK